MAYYRVDLTFDDSYNPRNVGVVSISQVVEAANQPAAITAAIENIVPLHIDAEPVSISAKNVSK